MPRGQPFEKLLNHPDKEQIEKWLREDYSTRKVEFWLQEKYPNQPDLQLNQRTIYKYKMDVLKMPKKQTKINNTRRERKHKGQSDRDNPVTDDDADLSTKIMNLRGMSIDFQEAKKELTSEQLLSWVNGEAGLKQFVEDMIIERGSRVTLQDYQLEMANLCINNDRVVFNTGGQIGKDFFIMCFSIWHAITNPNSLQMVVGATQTQTIELMNRSLSAIGASEDLLNCVKKTLQVPAAQIIFKNNARVLFLTAKSLLAGFTNVNVIWVNEARDVNEEEVTRVSPLLGVGSGKLFVLSRPRFRRGYFWECYDNPYFKRMDIPTNRNKFFDPKVLEADRATLSPELFKIEYMAEFADAGSSYFSEVAVNACSKGDYDFKTMHNAEPDYEYSLGIDWGRLRDSSVMTVIGQHKVTKKKKLFHIKTFSPEEKTPVTFEHQFAYIRLLDGGYNFSYIIPERSGLGIPLCERLVNEWKEAGKHPSIVKPYNNMSLEDKLTMYDECKRVIEKDEELQIPRSAFKLVNELKLTSFGATQKGQIKIEHATTDDHADSLCLSLIAFKKPFKMGAAVVRRGVEPNNLMRSN